MAQDLTSRLDVMISKFLEPRHLGEPNRRMDSCLPINDIEICSYSDGFDKASSLGEAISIATKSIKKNGKRHPHQYRLPKNVLNEAEKVLLARQIELNNCRKFGDLFLIVKSELSPIFGAGTLYIYDVAHRINFLWLKSLEPEHVYLHAGARIGARKLGVKGEVLPPSAFPAPIPTRLKPWQIEDFLCVMKNSL